MKHVLMVLTLVLSASAFAGQKHCGKGSGNNSKHCGNGNYYNGYYGGYCYKPYKYNYNNNHTSWYVGVSVPGFSAGYGAYGAQHYGYAVAAAPVYYAPAPTYAPYSTSYYAPAPVYSAPLPVYSGGYPVGYVPGQGYLPGAP